MFDFEDTKLFQCNISRFEQIVSDAIPSTSSNFVHFAIERSVRSDARVDNKRQNTVVFRLP